MNQMRRLTLCATALFFVAPSLLVPAVAQAKTNPISIQHCFVTVPKGLSKKAGGTQIGYVNRGSKTAESVTFAVGYRNAAQHFLRRVTDYGSFSPGVMIDHHFALYSDVTYAGKQTQGCQAVSVKWSDGTRWTY